MISHHPALVLALLMAVASSGVAAAVEQPLLRGRSLQDADIITNNVTNSTNSTNSTSSTNTTNTTDATTTVLVQIPTDCLNLLAATANENQKLKKENYFVFTDSMSNGYFSFNNMSSYADLPMLNKFDFVTLACQCRNQGGRGNCCQGDRAKIDVSGINDPSSMSTEMQLYVNDICSTTSATIGDKKLPPTGELPTTARPTTSLAPTLSPSPTDGPSVSIWPTDDPSSVPSVAPTTSAEPSAPAMNPGGIVDGGDGSDDDSTTERIGGLSTEGWIGIAIGSACVLTLLIYTLMNDDKHVVRPTQESQSRALALLNDDANDDGDGNGGGKEMLVLTNGEKGSSSSRHSPVSPGDGTAATASDMSSIPSMSTRGTPSPADSSGADSPLPMSSSDVSPMPSLRSTTRNNNSTRGSSIHYPKHPLLPSSSDEEDEVDVFTDVVEDDGIEDGIPSKSARSSIVDSPNSPSVKHLNTSRKSINSPSSILRTSKYNSSASLDQAIESGNWEAVAASAANIVKQNEPFGSSSLSPSVGGDRRYVGRI
mmetsp:Transcript_24623/g.53356  ORF Transcript_24623/g.53356 Transcript_24623/m.53356 type:complete len:539 (+) Transcript_24623:197-1813(+)